MTRAREVSSALVVSAGAATSLGGKDHATPSARASGNLARPELDLSPIFVHSSFRTSSTWLWSKLRAPPHTTAYYEIFHEVLAHCDVQQASQLDYTMWDSRHPAGAPYLVEFLPLMQAGGGIPGFSADMALPGFVPPDGLDGDLPDAQRNYVARLIANAHASGTIPVLCCTRTLGRGRALRKAFGGRTAFCHRNLFHQWASYAGQAMAGHPYFLTTIDLTLKAARHDPFLAAVDAWTSERTIAPTDQKLFQAFLLLHLYVSAQIYDDCDLLVDVTALAREPDVRRTVEAELGRMVSAPVDLSDVRLAFDASPLAVPSVRDISETISQFTKMIRATCRSVEAGAFVEQIKDAALSEWERHEFYVHKLRAIQGAQLERVERQSHAAVDRAQAAEAARDAVAEQVAAAAAEATALRQALEGLQQAHSQQGEDLASLSAAHGTALAAHAAESEALRARAAAAEQARDAYAARAHTSEEERARATAAGHAAQAATAQVHTALAALRADYDARAQRLNDVQEALAHQTAQAVAAAAERDHAVAELLTATMRMADLHAALTAATLERDGLARQLTARPEGFSRRVKRLLG